MIDKNKNVFSEKYAKFKEENENIIAYYIEG
jgi:hypothetical protein